MAHIHRISGCTQYLLNGIRPINGKKPATLDELHHIYNHYDEILAETKIKVTRQHDELIISLSNDESLLDQIIKEEITRSTREVDTHIEALFNKTEASESFFHVIVYYAQYLIATSLRSHHIRSPSTGTVRELHNVQENKRKHIANKSLVVTHECKNVIRSYEFIKNNQSFLIGADGEEYVISILSQLPSEYHVINDVNLHFQKAIHGRERNEYIKNCQIDHVVVGPTGIILVETKNWKSSDIELKSDELVHQVGRANRALWYYLKDYYESPKIQNVIVSMKGSPSGRKPDEYIDIVAPYQLCGYITSRRNELPEDMINKLVDLLDRSPR